MRSINQRPENHLFTKLHAKTLSQHKHCFNIIWIALSLLLLIPTETSATNLFVIIEGVETKFEENILSYLTIEQEKNNNKLSEDHIQRYFLMGTAEIQEALKPFGYYQTQVVSEIKKDQTEWRIYYTITLGPPAKINLLDIRISGSGTEEPLIQSKISEFPLRVNDIAVHELYEKGKKSLLHTLASLGYLDAKYTKNQIIIDPQTNKAEIHLYLETGEPYSFGKINFESVKVEEKLLNRYLEFKEGDRYSGKDVLNLQAALESSSYFARVAVIAERKLAKDYKIPIKVELSPNKPNKFDFGLGYGTDTGIRGRARWNRRLLGSRGHTSDVEATVSQIKQEFRASYYIPWRNPRSDRIELSAGLRNRETDTSDSIKQSVGASFQFRYNNWREANSLHIENTDFVVGKESLRTTELLVLGTNLAQIKADTTELIRRGSKLGFDLQGAWDKAFSDISFLRAEINGKLIVGLTKHGRLLLRGKFGTMTVSDFDKLPPEYRYFAGGDSSIRGYRYESQGPKNELGNVIGGQNIVETSIEADYSIGENWRAALFWDAGNAFDKRGDPLLQGAGIGIRYVLPIGMLRVDVAQAISEPDNPWRVHITIGPDL